MKEVLYGCLKRIFSFLMNKSAHGIKRQFGTSEESGAVSQSGEHSSRGGLALG
jgi:hypothetical protein